MIYCTLVLPHISEIWGNTYKTRIQPLSIIQKRAMRICNHLEYRAHSKPAFFKLKTLTIADLVKFKSMVQLCIYDKNYAKIDVPECKRSCYVEQTPQ